MTNLNYLDSGTKIQDLQVFTLETLSSNFQLGSLLQQTKLHIEPVGNQKLLSCDSKLLIICFLKYFPLCQFS